MITEQERFWAGGFGDDYVARNRSEALVAAKTFLWANVLRHARAPVSAVELGANIGLNLIALRRLFPAMALSGVEINAEAHAELATLPGVNAVINGAETSFNGVAMTSLESALALPT